MNDGTTFAGIRRRPRPFHRIELKDSNLPDPVVLQLRRPIDVEIDAANERAQPYITRYVTGGFRDAGDNWIKEPLVFLASDGEPIPLTETTVLRAAKIEAMQGPQDRKPIEWFFELSVFAEEAWEDLKDFALKVYSGLLDGKAAEGKDSREPSGGQPSS